MKAWLAVLALLFLSGEAWQATAQKAGGGATQLVGTWRLVSDTQRLTDGTVRPDPQTGPRGMGYVMYSETGRICAVLANPDRPKWSSETAPVDAELRTAFDGLVAYCGTYEVDEAQGTVVHHVELDKVPNRAGLVRKRHFEVSGNQLVLRPAPPLPEGVQQWTIVFERVTGN